MQIQIMPAAPTAGFFVSSPDRGLWFPELSTNYTNYHELKEQDKNKRLTQKQPPDPETIIPK